jgi:hypothetical protein
MHQVRINPDYGFAWNFNGDADKPTFTPSMLITGKRRLTDEEWARVTSGENVDLPDMRCHSFVTNGRIQFLSDCTHQLAGQTVPLPNFPARRDLWPRANCPLHSSRKPNACLSAYVNALRLRKIGQTFRRQRPTL